MATRKEAVEGAVEMAGEGVIPLILPARRPRPTQWLHPECVERFNAAWEEFVSGVTLGSGNDGWRWGTVPEGTELVVGGKTARSYFRCEWSTALPPNLGRELARKARRAGVLGPIIRLGDASQHHGMGAGYSKVP